KSTEQLRAQATFLLSQARSQLADIKRALSAASGDSALHSRLASDAAQIAGVASRISGALSGSSFNLSAGDLMALESSVSAADDIAQASDAETRSAAGAARIQAV